MLTFYSAVLAAMFVSVSYFPAFSFVLTLLIHNGSLVACFRSFVKIFLCSADRI